MNLVQLPSRVFCLNPRIETAKPNLLRRWLERALGPLLDRRPVSDEEVVRAIRSVPCHFTNLTQTPASVVFSTPSTIVSRTSNAAVTAGNAVAADSSGNWGPAAASSAILSGSSGIGVALDSAPGTGQGFQVWTSGTINLGATLQIGQVYVVSNTSGAICPYSDLTAGQYVTVLGVAITAALLYSPGGPIVSGVAHY